jgi:hypothetical protein
VVDIMSEYVREMVKKEFDEGFRLWWYNGRCHTDEEQKIKFETDFIVDKIKITMNVNNILVTKIILLDEILELGKCGIPITTQAQNIYEDVYFELMDAIDYFK